MGRLRDALSVATVILTAPLSRRPVRPLGDEAGRPLPGDHLLPEAKGRWTHGITMRGRPHEIWPWLAQMGCTRAGWYSYDSLDNGGAPSADRIIPELQQVEAGDLFPWTPTADDGFFVLALDPGRALVIGGDAGSLFRVTWAFVLEPVDETSTRLLTRASGDFDRFAARLMLELVAHPIDFAMQRKQLLNIKRRVEARGA